MDEVHRNYKYRVQRRDEVVVAIVVRIVVVAV
jgi:hypothetical protein